MNRITKILITIKRYCWDWHWPECEECEVDNETPVIPEITTLPNGMPRNTIVIVNESPNLHLNIGRH